MTFYNRKTFPTKYYNRFITKKIIFQKIIQESLEEIRALLAGE